MSRSEVTAEAQAEEGFFKRAWEKYGPGQTTQWIWAIFASLVAGLVLIVLTNMAPPKTGFSPLPESTAGEVMEALCKSEDFQGTFRAHFELQSLCNLIGTVEAMPERDLQTGTWTVRAREEGSGVNLVMRFPNSGGAHYRAGNRVILSGIMIFARRGDKPTEHVVGIRVAECHVSSSHQLTSPPTRSSG